MISHKHKCIFIHISKCAGSSVEHAFNIDVKNNGIDNHINLFGWDKKNELFLQHATPQQLFDFGYISKETWDNYYKFIIVRNPWDRAYSDYNWLKDHMGVNDDFINYLNAKGDFYSIMNIKNERYRGDHLNSQISYFYLNGKMIEYNQVLRFESLNDGFKKIIRDLGLKYTFLDQKINVHKGKVKKHYTQFYSEKTKVAVANKYWKDIEFLNYKFLPKGGLFQRIEIISKYFKKF